MSKEYVVKKGETLWEISKKIYGTGELYHIIAKENKISNPDTIQNGQIIKIPDVEFYTEKEVLEEAEKCGEYKKEIDRLNKLLDETRLSELHKEYIINELEKWLNEYYESNRKWYNMELSNHDKQYYEREYINTEFMIVKFKKQLKALKENNK